MSGPRVALLVTHLMGSGHLVRTLALARALAARGARPLVISGGRPRTHMATEGVEIAQLQSLASDGLDYRNLLRADGRRAKAVDYAVRRAQVAELVRAVAPRALITELWPFGRRALSGEFEAAVAARPRGARLFASIRDVLEPAKSRERVAETAARLAAYDLVLAHGEGRLLPLSASWPGAGRALPEEARARLIYTGYVSDPPPPPAEGPGAGEILVASGGGVIGRGLLEMAARASALSTRRWRLRVGGADAAAEAARLRELGPAATEPAAADYRERLGRAAASVSLCGYNTAVEVALCATPALFVPMEEGGEQEQRLRAEAFGRLPGLETARIGDLTPETLAARAEALAAAPRRAPALRAEGAEVAARAVLERI